MIDLNVQQFCGIEEDKVLINWSCKWWQQPKYLKSCSKSFRISVNCILIWEVLDWTTDSTNSVLLSPVPHNLDSKLILIRACKNYLGLVETLFIFWWVKHSNKILSNLSTMWWCWTTKVDHVITLNVHLLELWCKQIIFQAQVAISIVYTNLFDNLGVIHQINI